MLTGTFNPISNQATWSDYGLVLDAETRELIDLSDVTEITLVVSDPFTGKTELTGTMTGGEITVPDIGVYDWTFSATQMSALCSPRSYKVAVRITIDGTIIQLILADLPILYGLRT